MGVVFFDSFESGDLSATNEYGFKWASPNRTSVVNSTTRTHPASPVHTIDMFPGQNWTPKSGTHSLRFRYQAGTSWTEQRFTLGQGHRDLWFSFWLRVPVNFVHSENTPSNNKLFYLWMDGYSTHGEGATLGFEFWRGTGSTAGTSRLAYNVRSSGKGLSGGHTGHQGHFEFIRYPEDQGRWMQIVIHARASSSNGSNDGLLELWRRWADEPTFTKYHDRGDLNTYIPPDGPAGWANGYLMGWHQPYTEDTEWLIDDFIVSTTPLIE